MLSVMCVTVLCKTESMHWHHDLLTRPARSEGLIKSTHCYTLMNTQESIRSAVIYTAPCA